MNVRSVPPMDKATFFHWLERQERRHELVDGVPRMLPHVTASHNRITMNVLGILLEVLDRDVYDITQGDFAIETGEKSVRFADVMVFPFQTQPDSRSTDVAPLLVEVLSDTTMASDFGPKLSEYAGLAGVAQYLIIAQDRASVWSWVRQDDGEWPEANEPVQDMTAEIRVPGLGITLPMARIYHRVALR